MFSPESYEEVILLHTEYLSLSEIGPSHTLKMLKIGLKLRI